MTRTFDVGSDGRLLDHESPVGGTTSTGVRDELGIRDQHPAVHSGQRLTALVEQMSTAWDDRDRQAFGEAGNGLMDALRSGASKTERDAAAADLAPLLAMIGIGEGVGVAQIAGGLLGDDGTLEPLLSVLVDRVCTVMAGALEFQTLFDQYVGGMPSREPDVVARQSEEFYESARGAGLENAGELASSWQTGEDWSQVLLVQCQRAEVRRSLPQRDRLRDLVERTEDIFGDVSPWLLGLLRVLDDEDLVVLHRDSGFGFMVRIGGISDNFQLHTLLAANLRRPARRFSRADRGQLLADRPPTPEMIAAADGTGEMVPSGGVSGQFNLVDASGKWIWNEGRPDEIPLVDGRRVIVLDPLPYERSWSAGRPYPLMMPSIKVEPMNPAEAKRWLTRVAPAQEPVAGDVPLGAMMWTDDMSITIPEGHSIAAIVDFVIDAVLAGRTQDDVETALAVEFGLTEDDAVIARDRALGGVVRGGTGNDANRPSPVKDPIAFESYERTRRDPSLPARLYPDLFSSTD